MRKLQNTDLFAIGRIMSKANLKDEIKKLALSEDKDPESAGFELLYIVFTKCSTKEVEEEIFSFLADIFEMEIQTVKQMDPIETFEMLKKVDDWNKWKAVFTLAAK